MHVLGLLLDLYVATTGSDANPGTIDRPKATLTSAAAAAKAGDTVHVAAGSYLGGLFNQQGTAALPIRFVSDQPLAAVLENGNEPLRVGGGAAYLEFIGFEVRNSMSNAVHVHENAHHILLSNLRVHDAGLDGVLILVNDAHHVIIDRVDAFNPGASATNPAQFRNVVELINVADSVVSRSFIHNGAGVLLSARGSSQRIVIERNVIGQQDASADAEPALGLGGVTDAAQLKTPNEITQVRVVNNIIYAAGRGAVGIYDAQGAYLANNLFLNNDRVVIEFRAGGGSALGSDDVQFANNIFADTRGSLATPFARASHTLTNFAASFGLYWNNGLVIPPATGGVPADTTENGRITTDPKLSGAVSFANLDDAVTKSRPGPMSSAETPGADTSLPPFLVSDDILGFLRGPRHDRGPYNLGISPNGDGGTMGGDGSSTGEKPPPGGGGQLPPRSGCDFGGAQAAGGGALLALLLLLGLSRKR
jgi:hypothetical protein